MTQDHASLIEKISRLEAKITGLETRVAEMEGRLRRIEKAIYGDSNPNIGIIGWLGKLEREIQALKSSNKIVVGVSIATFVTLIGALIQTFLVH